MAKGFFDYMREATPIEQTEEEKAEAEMLYFGTEKTVAKQFKPVQRRKTSSNKSKYAVYCRHYYEDEVCKVQRTEWKYAGDTYAVSEAKAINNVRHRVYGDVVLESIGGNYEAGIEWKAEKQ